MTRNKRRHALSENNSASATLYQGCEAGVKIFRLLTSNLVGAKAEQKTKLKQKGLKAKVF